MGNYKILTYLKMLHNPYSFSLAILTFFIFILSLSFVSPATLNNLPETNLQYGNTYVLNLNDYGTSINPESVFVSFTNPDTNTNVFLIAPLNDSYPLFTTSSNSYFTINIYDNGLINIIANTKNLSNQEFLIGVGESRFETSVTKKFFLNIGSFIPIQIQQFVTPIEIIGNKSITYNLDNYFDNYNRVQITYLDVILNETAFLEVTRGDYAVDCSDGIIKVCVSSSLTSFSPILLGITSKSNAFNGFITIKAFNPFTATNLSLSSQTKLQVITSATTLSYTDEPVRLSLNPNGCQDILYNDSCSLDLNKFWTNFTYANITFINSTSGGNVTINQTGTSVFNNFDFSNYYVGLTSQFQVWVTSKSNSSSFNLFIQVCNANGCNSDNGVFPVVIHRGNPIRLPYSFDGTMKFQQTKQFNLNYLWENYDNYNITLVSLSDGSSNLTLCYPFQTGCSTSGVKPDGELVTPNIKVILGDNGILSVISGSNKTNYDIYTSVCNTEVCSSNLDLLNPPIHIYITSTGFIGDTELSNINIGSGTGFFNSFFSILPNDESLEKNTRYLYAFGIIAIFSFLMFGIGFFLDSKGGNENISLLMILTLMIDFLMMIFFTAIGYIDSIVMIVIAVLLTAIAYVKFKGGNSNG